MKKLLLILCLFSFSTYCSSIKIIAIKDKYGHYKNGWINNSQYQQIIGIGKQKYKRQDNPWLIPSSPKKSNTKNNEISQKKLFHYAVTNSLSRILNYLRGRAVRRCAIRKLAIYNELFHFFIKHISLVKKIEKTYKSYYILIVSYENLFKIVKEKLNRLIIRSQTENICITKNKV